VNQVAVSEKSGLTFAVGLRSILRQDPDVVMVGEIRDVETAQVAFQAAQTGHLVLATLHTNDAPSAVTRLVDMGIPTYLVTSSVIGVLSQRLVRRVCGCGAVQPNGTVVATGCPACRQSGYRGRIALQELLVMTSAVRKAIRDEGDSDAVCSAARRQGMQTLFEDGMTKVASGITTAEEIRRVAPPPEPDMRLYASRPAASCGAGTEPVRPFVPLAVADESPSTSPAAVGEHGPSPTPAPAPAMRTGRASCGP
jgi:general secretion pathway protein E